MHQSRPQAAASSVDLLTCCTGSVGELRELLQKRGLDTSGKKAVLQKRLLAAVVGNGGSLPAKRQATFANGMRGAAASPGPFGEAAHQAAVLQQLECPVCMELILPPVNQCSAGHLLCTDCKEQLQTPRTCPECRGALDNGRNLALERLAANFKLPCAHADKGCDTLVLYTQLQEHIRSCDFKPVSCICGEAGCDFRGSYKQLVVHLREACEHEIGRSREDEQADPHRIINFRILSSPNSTECLSDLFIGDDNAWNDSYEWLQVEFVHGVVFACRADSFNVNRSRAHNYKREGCVAFRVWFIGPEADRQKYTWTFVMGSEGSRNHIVYTAQPLSIHEIRDGGFPHGMTCGSGVFSMWEDDLRLFLDNGGNPEFSIAFEMQSQ